MLETASIKIFTTENVENRGFTNFIYDGIILGSKDGSMGWWYFLLIIGGSFDVFSLEKSN